MCSVCVFSTGSAGRAHALTAAVLSFCRLMYSQILYNSMFFGYEGGQTCTGCDVEGVAAAVADGVVEGIKETKDLQDSGGYGGLAKKPLPHHPAATTEQAAAAPASPPVMRLTPIGNIQIAAKELVDQHRDLGAHLTNCAVGAWPETPVDPCAANARGLKNCTRTIGVSARVLDSKTGQLMPSMPSDWCRCYACRAAQCSTSSLGSRRRGICTQQASTGYIACTEEHSFVRS